MIVAPVPDTVQPRILSRFAWGSDSVWQALVKNARTIRIATNAPRDRPMVTAIHLPVTNAMRADQRTVRPERLSSTIADATSAASRPLTGAWSWR